MTPKTRNKLKQQDMCANSAKGKLEDMTAKHHSEHHNGSVTVEKSDAEHDDNPQADDQRVYGVYKKKFDQKD